MREIIFRGKRTDNGKWIEGDVCRWLDATYALANNVDSYARTSFEVIPETVGQYTGLTDKNGTKIFEGDICKHRSNYSDNIVISTVVYENGHFLALVDKHSGFELSEKLEVIGNIHDNPELLKDGADNA